MPAFGSMAVALFALASGLSTLRRLGGWRAVRRARRGESPTLQWEELDPLEKTWYFGVVAFGAWAVALGLLGTGLVLTGNG